MLKASSLYIVLIVSLVIAIVSSSLITVAYYYRLEYQKNLRYNRLLTNLNSGIDILLSKDYKKFDADNIVDLDSSQAEKLLLRKERWGLFDLALVKSYVFLDTIKKAFFIGDQTDKDRSVIYLTDEDRPLSVSGNTQIVGDAYLPKAGVREAYMEGKSFTSGKLVNGAIKTSTNKLPALDKEIIKKIQKTLSGILLGEVSPLLDSTGNSFFNTAKVIRADSASTLIENKILKGKITYISDTLVRIAKSSRLNDIIIYATAIVVEDGFEGNCQLFATDSIVIGKRCSFNYPSACGVIRPEKRKIQPRISIGSGTKFTGIIFAYEETKSELQTFIDIGKNTLIEGEVFTGLLKFQSPLTIFGKVTCNRFLVETEESLYENYLVDVKLNRNRRSNYYLTSNLFTNNKYGNSILKWLD
jgi:hypothetical protein